MQLSPRLFKVILYIYGPYLGAGVKLAAMSKHWRNIHVSMNLRWYNRNAVGVHFGGSLYSMVDPHPMLMLMNILGKDYIVWDKSASIDFLRPGKGREYVDFSLTDSDIATILEYTDKGQTFLPEYDIEIKNARGKVSQGTQGTLCQTKERKLLLTCAP